MGPEASSLNTLFYGHSKSHGRFGQIGGISAVNDVF